MPVSQLGDPRVIRAALDGLCSPAAANTITRKRAVFHGALGYAVELGLLPANPVGLVRWHGLKAASAVSPATVPSPAQVRAILAATALARRPNDLRHAALSLWLNATGDPAEVAARAGNSARVLYEVYLHCTDGQQDAVSQRIEDALDAAAATRKKRAVTQTVSTTPDLVRHMYANQPLDPPAAHGHRDRPARSTARRHPPLPAFPQIRRHAR